MQQRVDEAFANVPRIDFLPESQREFFELNVPLPIGFSVTNSQPSTVRDMLLLLGAEPGERVLDVGSGSGWTSGLLAELVGADGLVIAVERIPQLVARSSSALTQFPQVTVHEALPGQLGWPEDSPYDRILVSAMADQVPLELVEQLRQGGTIVVPVQNTMLRVVKGTEGEVSISRHGGYTFVPLIE